MIVVIVVATLLASNIDLATLKSVDAPAFSNLLGDSLKDGLLPISDPPNNVANNWIHHVRSSQIIRVCDLSLSVKPYAITERRCSSSVTTRRQHRIRRNPQLITMTPPLGPATNICPEDLLRPMTTRNASLTTTLPAGYRPGNIPEHDCATKAPDRSCDPNRCQCTFYPDCIPCPMLPTTIWPVGPQPPFFPPTPDCPLPHPPELCPSGTFPPGFGICPLEGGIRQACVTPLPDPYPPTRGEQGPDGPEPDELESDELQPDQKRTRSHKHGNCHRRGKLTTPSKYKLPFPLPDRRNTAVEPFPRKPILFAPTDFPLWPPIYHPRKAFPPALGPIDRCLICQTRVSPPNTSSRRPWPKLPPERDNKHSGCCC